MTKSSFTQNRAKYQPKLPALLKKAGLQIEAKPVVKTTKSDDLVNMLLKELKPTLDLEI